MASNSQTVDYGNSQASITLTTAPDAGPPLHSRSKSSVYRILSAIRKERDKTKQTSDEEGYVYVNDTATAFWATILTKHFIHPHSHGAEGYIESESKDDLLFFVRDPHVACSNSKRYGSSSNLASMNDLVQVYRKESKNLPSLGDVAYNWEETVYLNLIVQHLEYTLTCAVCSRTGDRELQILNKRSQKVYASPSRRQMDSKGTGEVITYPDIFFTVDNFDEIFSDLVIRDSEMVCVELVASDKKGDFQAVIFIGSIRYDAIKGAFESKQSTLSAKMRHSFSWGVQGNSWEGRRTEFIKMKGPQGKGFAEMAISRQRGVPDTPGTTPLTTPSETPGQTPEREDLPPFPDGDLSKDQQNTYNSEDRRYSDTTNSPLKNSFKWGFGIRKSQSATDHVNQASDNHEVEAKSINEELNYSGMGMIGRSFGQAWHWFKEQRRAASVGLSTRLTYVTLPWHRIIADVLDNHRTPALTF